MYIQMYVQYSYIVFLTDFVVIQIFSVAMRKSCLRCQLDLVRCWIWLWINCWHRGPVWMAHGHNQWENHDATVKKTILVTYSCHLHQENDLISPYKLLINCSTSLELISTFRYVHLYDVYIPLHSYVALCSVMRQKIIIRRYMYIHMYIIFVKCDPAWENRAYGHKTDLFT